MVRVTTGRRLDAVADGGCQHLPASASLRGMEQCVVDGGLRVDAALEEERGKRMITRLTHVTVLVRDQDEALRFYTEKLGFEKRFDVAFGPGARWLTVAPVGQTN